jgi:hypothetical protein
MMEPTQDQRDRIQMMVADMSAVLDFTGWQAVHSATMKGQFGFQGATPEEATQGPR